MFKAEGRSFLGGSFPPVDGQLAHSIWSHLSYPSSRGMDEQSWYLQHHQANRETCSSAPKHRINKGRAFVFEVFKGGGTQWTARKGKPPDLLGFVKDVYRSSVSDCVAYISKISSHVFFCHRPSSPRAPVGVLCHCLRKLWGREWNYFV